MDSIASSASQEKFSGLRRFVRRLDKIFISTVVVPTALASLYFGLIASDVYVSESHFVVRSQQQQTPTALGALLQTSGLARSQDDTAGVSDFMRSRDALRELNSKLHLRAAYSHRDVDALNRFPEFDRDDSFEGLFRHYVKYVDVAPDPASSVYVLRVRAFTAEDARKTNEMLLEMGERLVNDLNLRSHHDLIEVAENEVRAAETRSKNAAQALSAFRADRRIFDPEREGVVQIAGTAKLREELVATQTQLAEVRRLSPDNPQVSALQGRVALLRDAVKSEDSRLLGRNGGLTSASPVYDRLALEKVFADKQLAGTMVALDTARNDAARQELYLARLVQPNLPDSAIEPRRLRSVITVFVLGLVAWGIVSLVVASIREHAD